MLDEAQEALLVELVEADRRVPRERRESFLAVSDMSIGFSGVHLLHPGWPDKKAVPTVDLDTLALMGLLQKRDLGRGDARYYVLPAGFQRYAEIKEAQGKSIQRVQRQVRDYLDGNLFRARHPEAFLKWQEAEELLWKDDSERAFTTIGHLCREAMQEFATSLLLNARIAPRQTEPAKTVDRIRQFLETRKPQLGKLKADFLDALLSLWGTVSDLVQRQEHGAQKEGRPLAWEDARLVVFHTMLTMFEVDAIAP